MKTGSQASQIREERLESSRIAIGTASLRHVEIKQKLGAIADQIERKCFSNANRMVQAADAEIFELEKIVTDNEVEWDGISLSDRALANIAKGMEASSRKMKAANEALEAATRNAMRLAAIRHARVDALRPAELELYGVQKNLEAKVAEASKAASAAREAHEDAKIAAIRLRNIAENASEEHFASTRAESEGKRNELAQLARDESVATAVLSKKESERLALADQIANATAVDPELSRKAAAATAEVGWARQNIQNLTCQRERLELAIASLEGGPDCTARKEAIEIAGASKAESTAWNLLAFGVDQTAERIARIRLSLTSRKAELASQKAERKG